MKANAPENIYIQPDAQDGWFMVNNLNNTLVKYTRTDAFIEKATNFLNYKLGDVVNVRVPGALIPEITTRQDFIEHFKKYMEGCL